jgi:hypothetical protein
MLKLASSLATTCTAVSELVVRSKERERARERERAINGRAKDVVSK